MEWLQWVLIPRMHDLLDNNQRYRALLLLRPIMKWRWRLIIATRAYSG